MTRSELISVLADRFPQLMVKDAEASVYLIIEAIREQLVRGGRVEIRGFGSFSLNFHPARQGRNPKNGDVVAVPPKWAPHFKPGKELRQNVNAASNST